MGCLSYEDCLATRRLSSCLARHLAFCMSDVVGWPWINFCLSRMERRTTCLWQPLQADEHCRERTLHSTHPVYPPKATFGGFTNNEYSANCKHRLRRSGLGAISHPSTNEVDWLQALRLRLSLSELDGPKREMIHVLLYDIRQSAFDERVS